MACGVPFSWAARRHGGFTCDRLSGIGCWPRSRLDGKPRSLQARIAWWPIGWEGVVRHPAPGQASTASPAGRAVAAAGGDLDGVIGPTPMLQRLANAATPRAGLTLAFVRALAIGCIVARTPRFRDFSNWRSPDCLQVI